MLLLWGVGECGQRAASGHNGRLQLHAGGSHQSHQLHAQAHQLAATANRTPTEQQQGKALVGQAERHGEEQKK